MIEYVAEPGDQLRNILAAVIVRDLYGQVLFTLSSHLTGQNFERLSGTGTLSCRVPTLPLAADTYIVDLWSSVNGEPSDCIQDVLQLSVVESDFYGAGKVPVKRKHGPFIVNHSWNKLTN